METKPSRAEYMRAYRARKAAAAAPASPHICERCHEPFAVERTDARYCSDGCRAAAWREITHRITAPITSGRCFHRHDGESCTNPATWLLVHVRNETRHLAAASRWCDEHLPSQTTCDPDCARGGTCPAIAGLASVQRLLEPDATSDAIRAFTEHKEHTDPSWLDGKRPGKWSKAAKEEAWRWWVRENGLNIAELAG